jgi:hypothetical protein
VTACSGTARGGASLLPTEAVLTHAHSRNPAPLPPPCPAAGALSCSPLMAAAVRQDPSLPCQLLDYVIYCGPFNSAGVQDSGNRLVIFVAPFEEHTAMLAEAAATADQEWMQVWRLNLAHYGQGTCQGPAPLTVTGAARGIIATSPAATIPPDPSPAAVPHTAGHLRYCQAPGQQQLPAVPLPRAVGGAAADGEGQLALAAQLSDRAPCIHGVESAGRSSLLH